MESTRSSQTAWINPHPNNKWLYDPIDARIESITGYTTQTSENYQVVNYGLAGHYNVHHDPNGVRGVRIKIYICIYTRHHVDLFNT